MDDFLLEDFFMFELIVGIVIGATAGAIVIYFWMKSKNAAALAEANAKASFMEQKIAEHKTESEELKKQLSISFENIAMRIFEERNEKFKKLNADSVFNLLKPLGDNIENFRKKVEEAYDKESKERFSLEKEIKKLVELNQKISEDANNLTSALKGNSKTQGNWGEMILENILEKSGLLKNREYFVQALICDNDGNPVKNENGQKLQPDITIIYPDERKLIVDSKASLTAYIKYVNADSIEEQKSHIDEHIRSVKKHIDELSAKRYEDFAKSLDFVIMFIPNEGAYIAALQYDSSLWDYAYTKRIVLTSPSNMIIAVKIVADLWKKEYQNKNTEEIAKRGAILYDKFVNFTTSLLDIGQNLDKAQKSYLSAINQLKDGNGNLIGQAEKLKELGVKPKKSIASELKGE